MGADELTKCLADISNLPATNDSTVQDKENSAEHPRTATESCLRLLQEHTDTISSPWTADKLALQLSGLSFTYELKSLDSDPKEIIQLLKITGSERGNWMLVGAHYRRNANPAAAVRVATAMIEEATKLKVPEFLLKPVFLFLSSCEMDLRRSAKEAAQKKTHHTNAENWLQKVYGTLRIKLPLKELAKPAAKTDAPVSTASGRLPTRPPAAAHHKILEREIKALRDRLQDTKDEVAELRVSKRKLQEDLEWERDTRRRQDRELDDLRKELDLTSRIRDCGTSRR